MIEFLEVSSFCSRGQREIVSLCFCSTNLGRCVKASPVLETLTKPRDSLIIHLKEGAGASEFLKGARPKILSHVIGRNAFEPTNKLLFNKYAFICKKLLSRSGFYIFPIIRKMQQYSAHDNILSFLYQQLFFSLTWPWRFRLENSLFSTKRQSCSICMYFICTVWKHKNRTYITKIFEPLKFSDSSH